MRSPLPLLPGLVLSCVFSIPAQHAFAADAPHLPTSEDLRHLKSIGGPQLSPDGAQVLFSVTDSTADGGKTHLWVVGTHPGDKPRQLTFSPPSDKRGERNPQWGPDGSAIYFTAHRNEHTGLFRLDLRGGEAAPLQLKTIPLVDESKDKNAIPPPGSEKEPEKTKEKSEGSTPSKTSEALPLDVAGYLPSPDGKWIAVWAHDPQTPGEKKQKDAKADAAWVNHERHFTRLYLVAVKPDGAVESATLTATGVEPEIQEAAWDAQSDRLLVITEPPNDLSDLGPANSAWSLEAAHPDRATKLSAIPPTVRRAVWSSDGESIVLAAAASDGAPPGYDEFYIVSRAASGAKIIPLTSGFKGQVSAGSLYPEPDGSLISEAGIGTHLSALRVSLDGKSAPTSIDLGAAVITGLNTNQKRTGWTWLAESGGHPVSLCYAQHLGDGCTALAIPELAPSGLQSIQPERVHWTSDGLDIEGLLYLPPSHAGKVPLIVDVHGGPFGAWEDRNDDFAAFLVGRGYAVLHPNPRGSSNYGTKFAAANKNDLGGGDYRDVMAGVDAVIAKYPLDPDRMALMGYSYGGEMAGFVEGKTDRFKAIISGAPVIDQFSEYGTERGSWYDRWYFGKPWEHQQDAWKQSPVSGAAHAKTPFLLLQGESDVTDPPGQSQEMYRALRQEGVPVELVTYPREDHGPLAGGMYGRPEPEPWHGFDARQRIVEFLDKYLSH